MSPHDSVAQPKRIPPLEELPADFVATLNQNTKAILDPARGERWMMLLDQERDYLVARAQAGAQRLHNQRLLADIRLDAAKRGFFVTIGTGGDAAESLNRRMEALEAQGRPPMTAGEKSAFLSRCPRTDIESPRGLKRQLVAAEELQAAHQRYTLWTVEEAIREMRQATPDEGPLALARLEDGLQEALRAHGEEEAVFRGPNPGRS
eukprot:tig00000492_g1548.t1